MPAAEQETVVELGMTKQEILRALERDAPEHGRLTTFAGDVDLVLVWRVRDGRHIDGSDAGERVTDAEEHAWRAWVNADSRARVAAEAERQAHADVTAAREAWQQAVRDLADVKSSRPRREPEPAAASPTPEADAAPGSHA
jgi:uncharacterized repeat protein (TIGR03917 family)